MDSGTSGSDNRTRVVIHSPRFRYATLHRGGMRVAGDVDPYDVSVHAGETVDPYDVSVPAGETRLWWMRYYCG